MREVKGSFNSMALVPLSMFGVADAESQEVHNQKSLQLQNKQSEQIKLYEQIVIVKSPSSLAICCMMFPEMNLLENVLDEIKKCIDHENGEIKTAMLVTLNGPTTDGKSSGGSHK